MVVLTEEQTALREIGLSPPAVEPITEREMITKLISTWRGRLQELIPRREALDQELVQVREAQPVKQPYNSKLCAIDNIK